MIGKTDVYTTESEVEAGTGDIVHITSGGMYCKWSSGEQLDGYCLDYEVRFCCLECEWTDWLDRDNPGGTGDFEVF